MRKEENTIEQWKNKINAENKIQQKKKQTTEKLKKEQIKILKHNRKSLKDTQKKKKKIKEGFNENS